MSLKHAVLGFLSYKPHTGYDLKKAFDRSVRHFWPANQSQIYRTLAELKEEGWVDQETVEREERLDMKIYHITPAGQAELHRWLATPLPQQDYREAFLIQIYFGAALADAELVGLIRHQIAELEAAQAQLQGMFQLYRSIPPEKAPARNLFFSMLPLEYGITSNQAAIQWLQQVLQRLEHGDYTAQDLSDLRQPG